MQCPSCGAVISDEQARFCSRCGAALVGAEGEATGPLADEAEPTVQTAPSEPTIRTTPPGRASSPFPVREFAQALRGSFVSGGWSSAAGAAAVAFLFLLGMAAILLVAFRLDFPSVGTGGNPFGVLSALALIALGSLGAPLRFGDLVVGFLPLGALLVGGCVLIWAAGQFAARRDAEGLRARALEGAKVGAPFALYCLIAALVFRLRASVDVSADPAAAFFLGALWGGVFGALGGMATGASVSKVAGELLGGVQRRRRTLYEGVRAGGIMLAATALLSLAALLLWIIVGLIRGDPSGGLNIGDAVAALVYLLFTLPNLLALIAAIGLGAPVEVGARVVFSGRLVGPLEEFSLFGWGGETIGAAALPLLLIPLLSCLLGGFSARRSTADPARVWEVVAVAAATYGVTLLVVVLIGSVRLGAGVTGRGFGRLAADPLLTLLWALAWAALAGFAGWKLAEVQETKSATTETGA